MVWRPASAGLRRRCADDHIDALVVDPATEIQPGFHVASLGKNYAYCNSMKRFLGFFKKTNLGEDVAGRIDSVGVAAGADLGCVGGKARWV
jgi:hypothetical protein